MEVQPYNEADHGETVGWWWEQHTGWPFERALLPPVGVVGIDEDGPSCACWLHLSAGVGVCFIENPVSRPGLGMKQAADCFKTLLEALQKIALAHDYGVMVCNTMPAIARILKRCGFDFNETHKITGMKLLR